MPYNFVVKEPGDTPRALTCAAVGVGTGLLGEGVPFLGLVVAGLLQIVQPKQVIATAWEHVNDGVVDGSAALLGHSLTRAALPPRAKPYIGPPLSGTGQLRLGGGGSYSNPSLRGDTCRGCTSPLLGTAQYPNLQEDDANALAGG